MRTDRAAVQKGRVLLQAFSPDGPEHMGGQGPRGRVYGGGGTAPAHLPPHISGAKQRSWKVLDGRAGVGFKMLKVTKISHLLIGNLVDFAMDILLEDWLCI